MKYIFLKICFLFICISCTNSNITIDHLFINQGKYYLQDSNNPYSGKVVTKFENGNISNVIELKNGIPNGKWIAYGYKNEIVQEGMYTPIEINSLDTLFTNLNIGRLNVCHTKEGSKEFTDVFLITNNSYKTKERDIKTYVSQYLKNHLIIPKEDSIYEIICLKGELESQ